MSTNTFVILEKLSENFRKFPENTAFHIQGTTFTYRQFEQRISAIQNYLLSNIPVNERYIGVMSLDDVDTYASIFALWFSGKAFVPLNPLNPLARNLGIIRQMSLKHILGAGECNGLDSESIQLFCDTLSLADSDSEPKIFKTTPETDAYVLFTSGSTGKPKGVRINRANLNAFYRSYTDFGPGYTSSDRFLQIYDISFDGSVPCYMVALCSGASVYTVPQNEIKYLYAYKLMKDSELTVVKMTPSTLIYLRPYFDRIHLPHVRVCIFGGEALPLEIVEEWMKCVPEALIQNAYGPTEASIDSLMYTYNAGDFKYKSKAGIISLGKSFGDFEYSVIDSGGKPVALHEQGELCLQSAQVMSGYWNDEEKTNNAFIFLGTGKFYRTGDLVSRDKDGYFYFHGRIDDQVQMQGYRVETGEIENHAREITSVSLLAAVPYRNSSGNSEIALFIGDDEQSQELIITGLESVLPSYMIPSKIIFMKELPLLTSGKTDRYKLSQIADEYEKH